MRGYIGLDIGGSKILGILYDESGEGILKIKKKTKAHEGLESVLEQLDKVLSGLMEAQDYTIGAVGAGVPGLVDAEGVVSFSPNLPFRNFDLKGHLKAEYGVEAYVGNDVNVAMYGEYARQQNPTVKNVVGLFVGTGVGGAIVIDGRLYIGRGAAAELGHMVVMENGAKCGCGAFGCLEAYASKTAITQYIKSHLERGGTSVLSGDLKGIFKSSLLEKAYESGDLITVEAVDRASRALGVAIGSLINIFHPDQIILGGGVISALGDVMLPRAQEVAKGHTMPGLFDTVGIELSSLGDEAGTYGGFALAKAIETL